MAIQSNSSDVTVTGGGIPLYTGIAAMRVIAVNPTVGELASLGINLKSEPVYTGITFGEQTKNKLCFWLHNDEKNFNTRMEILVEDKHRKASSTGKHQVTNKYGQVTWAENPESTPDWFKNEGVRRMYPGEEVLINFVKAWANIPNDGECSFDTIDDMMKGNVTEMKSLCDALKDNKLRVLLGVKDNKYQQVYTRCFGRLKPKRDDIFVRALNQDYGDFRAEYNDDLQFRAYEPEVVKATEESTPTAEAEDTAWL